MWSIFIRAEPPRRDWVISRLWDFGTAGLIEEADGLRAFFEDGQSVAEVRAAFGDFLVETRAEAPPDPDSFSRENWEPVLLGESFLVAPSWLDVEVPPHRQLLKIDASSAFGTGRHESTQLAVRALEKYMGPGSSVLDVGCGSGILSLAAARLGAGQVLSCDLDPEAIRVARRPLETPLFLGSADAVRASFSDLTLANISSRVIDLLAGQLKRVTKPEGRLILAGFLRENPPQRFHPDEVLELEGWFCWICCRNGVLSTGGDEEAAGLQDGPCWWT